MLLNVYPGSRVQPIQIISSNLSSRGCVGEAEKPAVPANLVHIVVGPGRGKWDRKQQKNIGHRKNQHPSKCWVGQHLFEKQHTPK